MQSITVSIRRFQKNFYMYARMNRSIIVVKRVAGLRKPATVLIIERPTSDSEEVCDRCSKNVKCSMKNVCKDGSLVAMWLCCKCEDFFASKGYIKNSDPEYERTKNVLQSLGDR